MIKKTIKKYYKHIIFGFLFGVFFINIFATYKITKRKIAISFDDLPCQDTTRIMDIRKINYGILDALEQYSIKAIGFVNEIGLYNDRDVNKKIRILKKWVKKGHSLGNHTYSHKAFSESKSLDYENEIVKGEEISNQLMLKYQNRKMKYFRPPYLDTGSTLEKNMALSKILDKHNYILVLPSIDSDDWSFNAYLKEHPEQKDVIIEKYADYVVLKLKAYEKISEKLFAYKIKQILMFHVNYINSCSMNVVLKKIKNAGYSFITIDEALQDKAYKIFENNVFTDEGMSRSALIPRWSKYLKKMDLLNKESPKIDL